jgi:dihydrofolate reductase
MGKVVFDISMSLDGYVAGPDDGPELGLGEGGERLHEWVYGLASWREPHGLEGGETNASSEVMEEMASSGAVIVGKRMFDNAHGWGDEPPFHKPVFVLTHTAREPLTKSDTTFTFVTDGIESAVEQAKSAAGDKDVSIGGGASTIQQALKAGLVDEARLTFSPVLLGGGVPLFEGLGPEDAELELVRVIEGPKATHVKYRVVR